MNNQPPNPPTPTPGMTPEQVRMVREAKARTKKIRRAASVASFNAWTLAIFAAISLVIALWGDVTSMVMTVALGVPAFIEFRGAAMFRQVEPRAPEMLGINQLALTGVILAYCGWNAYAAMALQPAATPVNSGSAEVDAMYADMTASMSKSLGPLVAGLYAVVGVLAAAGTLVNAWYYFSRKPILEKFIAETPEWVVETLRAAS